MNWSNGEVASSRHAAVGRDGRRARTAAASSTGRAAIHRDCGNPKKPWLYQKNPAIVVTTIAAIAISNRLRSSRRWSTSDIVPSGLTRARRRRGSSRLRIPGVCTGSPMNAAYRRGIMPRSAGRRRSGRSFVGRLGRRSPAWSVDIAVRCDRSGRRSRSAGDFRRLHRGLRLGFGLHLLDLRLEDPH